MRSPTLGAACVLCSLSVGEARAEEPDHAPAKDGYSLFNPTPRELWRPMSADRPDLTESPYTVDAGAVQLEMSLAEFVYDDSENEVTRSLSAAPINLKIGVTNDIDVQILFNPYEYSDTAGSGHAVGVGDFGMRMKINLWGNDGGATAGALLPFIVFPTGDDDAGVDRVEGGLIVPIAIELRGGWGLGLQAEIDAVYDQNGGDYDAVFSHTAVVGHAIIGELSGYLEYVGSVGIDGSGGYEALGSTGLTYRLSPDAQLDAGVAAGLTDGAEDLRVFAGFTIRF